MANDNDEKSDGLLGDTLKKVLSTGITAAFMTEEAIRSRVSDLKLPKETLALLLSGASKGRDELMNRVSNEIIRVINKIDFVKEASRFVEEHKFRVTAEIEVMKKDGAQAASSSVSNESSIKVSTASTPKASTGHDSDV